MKREFCNFVLGCTALVQLMIGTTVALLVAVGRYPDTAMLRFGAYVYLGLSALGLLAYFFRHLRWDSDA